MKVALETQKWWGKADFDMWNWDRVINGQKLKVELENIGICNKASDQKRQEDKDNESLWWWMKL